MQPRSAKLLWDLCDAARFIISEATGVSLDQYEGDRRLRYSVERSFEIIGEAARRIVNEDPALASLVPNLRQVIDFRNLIAHGYDEIDNARVLAVIRDSLPDLLATSASLLSQFGA